MPIPASEDTRLLKNILRIIKNIPAMFKYTPIPPADISEFQKAVKLIYKYQLFTVNKKLGASNALLF